MNPETGETCEECNGSGYMAVSFAEGRLFTRKCVNEEECGMEMGGYIVEDDALSEPPEPAQDCLICKNKCVWLLLGSTNDLGLT